MPVVPQNGLIPPIETISRRRYLLSVHTNPVSETLVYRGALHLSHLRIELVDGCHHCGSELWTGLVVEEGEGTKGAGRRGYISAFTRRGIAEITVVRRWRIPIHTVTTTCNQT